MSRPVLFKPGFWCFAVIFDLACLTCQGSEQELPISAKPKDPCIDVPVSGGSPRQASNGELVLVTGAAGFIGSNLVEQLLELGYHVRVLDNLATGNLLYLNLRHPRLEFVFGDIMDKDTVRKVMVGVVGVFHLAAASKVLPSLKDPSMATFNIERNAVGTSLVMEVANETKLVRKVVYAASSTYYGNQEAPFEESAAFAPSSPYAASKYMGELQMQTNDALYGIPALSLRFFMVYGPRNPSEGAYAVVTGKFIRRRIEGKALLIEGSGAQYRDFIHVADVARACILGYQSDVHGTVINVGSGIAYSVKEAADLISEKQEHVAPRFGDLKGTLADTCRARRLLGFASRHDFASTIRSMLARAEANAGSDDYLAEMWGDRRVVGALERHFPTWSRLAASAQTSLLQARLAEDPEFIRKLIQELDRDGSDLGSTPGRGPDEL